MHPSFIIHDFWSRYVAKRSLSRLEMLPPDVIVDDIMSCLDVRDIVNLRRVGKYFYALSMQPAIWKRFLPSLSRIDFPLARLPPTARYNVQPLRSIDVEHVVTRALSLDNNWRSDRPKPFETISFETYTRVLELAILPGGHYTVGSVCSNGVFAIQVWSMDNPACGGVVPLIIRKTGCRAYRIQAKYMFVRGKKGIVVAFLRKVHKEDGDTREIPVSIESGGDADPEDPDMPLRYECATLFISLEALDRLTDRRLRPNTPEFVELAHHESESVLPLSRFRSGKQLGAISLDQVGDTPYVVVVKRPAQMVFECLNTNRRSTLVGAPSLMYPQLQHAVWNIKLIPDQGHILSIRRVDARVNGLYSPFVVDLFDIPALGRDIIAADPVQSFTTYCHSVSAFQISEVRSTMKNDDSMWPKLVKGRPLPPISLYGRQENEEGMVHICIWPLKEVSEVGPNADQDQDAMKVDLVNPRYRYDLSTAAYQNTYKFPAKGGWGSIRILPGSHRAIMYSVPRGWRSTAPPLKKLYAYVCPEKGYARILQLEGAAAVQGEVPNPNPAQMQMGQQQGQGQGQEDHDMNDPLNMPGNLTLDVEDLPSDTDSDKSSPSSPTSRTSSLRNSPEPPIWPYPRKKLSEKKCMRPVKMHPYLAEQLDGGLSAIAWDEEIGRLVLTTTKDGQMHVMDFAYARESGDHDREFFRDFDEPLATEMEMD